MAALFAIGLVLLVATRPAISESAPEEDRERPHVLRDLRDGFAFMVRTPWLLWTLLFASIFVLVVLGPIEVLLPFIAQDRFADGAQTYGFILAFFGIGSAIGALAVSSRRLPRRYLTVMMTMWGVGSLPLVVVGATSSFAVMAVATFVVGVTDGAGMVIWGTLLQRRVPTEMLGRVSSLDFFVSLAFMPRVVRDRRAAVEGRVDGDDLHRGGRGTGGAGRGRHGGGADAARRDRQPAAVSGSDAEHRWQCEHHDQPPEEVGQHGCEHSTGDSAFVGAHRAEDDARESEHRVARRGHRDDVDDRRQHDGVTPAERGVQRAAEEHLLGDAVDHRDEHDEPQGPVVGVLEHAHDVVADWRDLAGHQAADDEHRAQRARRRRCR